MTKQEKREWLHYLRQSMQEVNESQKRFNRYSKEMDRIIHEIKAGLI